MKYTSKNQTGQRRLAFSLVELLVVIAIIAVMAAMLLAVSGVVSKTKKINTAQAEMQLIETALENYKAKYGVYPPCNPANALVNQLYYELSGVTNVLLSSGQPGYQTLDAVSKIGTNDTLTVFNIGGILNSYKGSGEDMVQAKNFLPGLKTTQLTFATNTASGNLVYYLATSVGGPDVAYHPAYAAGFNGNPFRYIYPGTNNPNSYDLWVQLSIGSTATIPGASNKKYLVCNWKQQVELNNPLP
jgi:prepilin-type N-terminal cleavage/methylation domain-containing protein